MCDASRRGDRSQPASSSGVAGFDGDLFTEEAGEEFSEPLSEGTVVRIVGLQKRWELFSRTGRLLGPREFDGRVPVLVKELLLGGVVIAKEERVCAKIDNIMVLSVAAAGQNLRVMKGFSRKVPKSLRNKWFFEDGAKILSELWFSEEGCCVKDFVHERARLLAVVQCSGVCEATALAQRSGGQ